LNGTIALPGHWSTSRTWTTTSRVLGPVNPTISTDLSAIDQIWGRLIEFYEANGIRDVILSEYGITGVSRAVHLNRVLRSADLLAVRAELGEVLEVGASAAFAVSDHQIVHIYVNDPDSASRVRELLEHTGGVEAVLDAAAKVLIT
jgi:hypothetical protein